MPAQSKAQFKFMEMIAHNPKKMKNKPKSLSSEQAKEFLSKNKGKYSYKNLPNKVTK